MQTIWLSPTGFVAGDPSLELAHPSALHPGHLHGNVLVRSASAGPKALLLGLPLQPNVTIDAVTIT